MIDVSIDFETYSELDLKKVGAWAYSEHPSTEVICMAYAYEDDDPQLWLPEDNFPEFLQNGWRKDYMIHAWNSFFEWCIMKNTLKIEPPPITQWTDTQSLASASALPKGLGECGRVLGLPANEAKDKRGKWLISKLSSPQNNTKKKIKEGAPETYRNWDSELLQEFYSYCKRDVVAERAIGKRLLKLTPSERLVWELDQEINIRGVEMDSHKVQDCISIHTQYSNTLMIKLQELTGLENPNSQKQFLGWLKEQGYTGENVQAETLREFLKEME